MDTEYAVLHSLQDTLLRRTGCNMPIHELTFALGITGMDCLRHLEIVQKEAFLQDWEAALAEYHSTVRVFDGIEDTLKELIKQGYSLGIVTSKTKAEFTADFSVFGIDHYFQTVICADDTERHKPNPDPLLKYMERSGCCSAEVLYIGNSIYDRKCAEAAACDFALALWGAKKEIESTPSCAVPSDILNYIL